jgi:hypothetical protein
MKQIDVNAMTRAEFALYLDLLPHAYALEQEQTGLVCGATAEALRDGMYTAISLSWPFGVDLIPDGNAPCK